MRKIKPIIDKRGAVLNFDEMMEDEMKRRPMMRFWYIVECIKDYFRFRKDK